MHVNRRHKKVACPKCEKHFVKQADCDNHFRDVHKFVCSLKGCSVFKYNELELHKHMRHHHQPEYVFRCNKCVKVFRTRPQLHQHHEVQHDYNDDSQVDPEFRPTKKELRDADKEGDS